MFHLKQESLDDDILKHTVQCTLVSIQDSNFSFDNIIEVLLNIFKIYFVNKFI